MIIELLYPKEMKDAVKKLRVENDLNEEALKNFHYQIIIRIAVCLIIAAILIGIENSYISWTISILLIFLMPFDIKRHYKMFMASYLFGKKDKGTVIKKISIRHSSKKLKIKTTDQNEITIGPLREFWKNPECPDVDDEIQYYQDTSKKFKPMPDLYFINKKYCLIKSLL